MAIPKACFCEILWKGNGRYMYEVSRQIFWKICTNSVTLQLNNKWLAPFRSDFVCEEIATRHNDDPCQLCMHRCILLSLLIKNDHSYYLILSDPTQKSHYFCNCGYLVDEGKTVGVWTVQQFCRDQSFDIFFSQKYNQRNKYAQMRCSNTILILSFWSIIKMIHLCVCFSVRARVCFSERKREREKQLLKVDEVKFWMCL